MRTNQGSYPAHAPAKTARLKEDAPKPAGRPSSLVDIAALTVQEILDEHIARKLA